MQKMEEGNLCRCDHGGDAWFSQRLSGMTVTVVYTPEVELEDSVFGKFPVQLLLFSVWIF